MIELSSVIDAIAASGVVPDMGSFDPQKTFKENGVDSLDVMTILLTIEEKLNIQITEDEASQINSATKLINIVNGR